MAQPVDESVLMEPLLHKLRESVAIMIKQNLLAERFDRTTPLEDLLCSRSKDNDTYFYASQSGRETTFMIKNTSASILVYESACSDVRSNWLIQKRDAENLDVLTEQLRSSGAKTVVAEPGQDGKMIITSNAYTWYIDHETTSRLFTECLMWKLYPPKMTVVCTCREDAWDR